MKKSLRLKDNRDSLPLVVILTAIKTEFKTVVAHLTNRLEETGDRGTVYECGDFNVPGGQSWKVAVAECGAGNQRAAAEVHLAINYFNPEIILFVGIAGSLKKDIKLGDVIASTKVYGYHSGKSDAEFHPRPELAFSSYSLEQRARATARNNKWLQRLERLGNSHRSSGMPPEAYVGPIAAGEQVVSKTASPTFQLISNSYSDALAVEMEGYGTLHAASYYGVGTIVIRGISDQIDNKPGSDAAGCQQIASQSASAFAFEMLANFQYSLPSSLLPIPNIQSEPMNNLSAIKAEPSSPSIEWVIILDGELNTLDAAKIKAIEENLRDLSQDRNLVIKKIENGSIVVNVESTKDGFQKVNQLYARRILSKIADIPIKLIYSQDQYLKLGEMRAGFKQASQDLFAWPTTLDGEKWLNRKELGQIDSLIRTQRSSSILLLGPPGSGKSALLSKLGANFTNQGFPVLAIKADRLEVKVKSLEELGQFLNLPDDPISCVRLLALNQPTLVIVDQLDALADLVDLHSQRLNVLLDFINTLSERENIHLVCSCREFEYHHDIRLNSIQSEALNLSPPAWEEISLILSPRGMNALNWPQGFRDILLIPQHLKIFLEFIQGSGEMKIFESYQTMLEGLWNQKVTNREGLSGRAELLTEMAIIMGDEETLWLPTARFEDRLKIIEGLVASGILIFSEQGKSIGFRHQTLFDFARARAFAKGQGSLSEFVFSRQDALFVRPKLWSSLVYLRGADQKTYKREFDRLWNGGTLRLHIRFLLIEFLGQLDDPDEQEAKWLFDYLTNPELREKVLFAIQGKKRWFELISQSYLPALMNKTPAEKSRGVKGILISAWPFAREKNLKLIKKYWLPDKNKDTLTWSTMQVLSAWDVDTVQIICDLIARSEIHSDNVIVMATTVSAAAPELAPRIVATALNKNLAEAMTKNSDVEEHPPENLNEEEEFTWHFTHDSREPFKKLIEGEMNWYDLPKLAEAAPQAFLETLWPWFLKVIELISEKQNSLLVMYRSDFSLATSMKDDRDALRDFPLITAIERAITQWAVSNPSAFLEFLNEWQSTDLLTIQRLLARGLIKIASIHPLECLNFLINDPRRLILGHYDDKHSDTKSLISALVPHLSKLQSLQLEKRVMDWSLYRQIRKDESAKVKLDMSKWDREHRLSLLKAFPPESLSVKAKKLIQVEDRALPHGQDQEKNDNKFQSIESPMSSEQMAKAKDEHILNLFNELVDNTEWNHPRHLMKGGSIEASRTFADFAKKHPERAILLINQMIPGRQERPVGYAIEKLAEIDYPSEALFKLIIDLNQRGFKSKEFRVCVAWALEKRAQKEKGLPESICSLLERWLDEPWELEKDEPDEDETEQRSASKDDGGKDKRSTSLLWGHGGLITLPQGTYTILSTLTCAYLFKRPMETERWLRLLKSHLERPESNKTWCTLSRQFRFLVHCDHDQAIDFLKALFHKYPKVRDSQSGVILIAHLQSWLPEEVIKEFLYALRSSEWEYGSQAFGEILLLRQAYFPKEEWSDFEISELLDKQRPHSDDLTMVRSGGRLGLAFSAAHLWDSSRFRGLATDILIQLVPLANEAIAQAIMDVFRLVDTLYADELTYSLLDTLLAFPQVLKIGRKDFIIERIQDLLPGHPDLVYRICKTLLDLSGDKLAGGGTLFSLHATELIDIALTLQRYEGKYRPQGLELFERLLELEAYGARDVLAEIDSRPLSAVKMPKRSPCRKRQPK